MNWTVLGIWAFALLAGALLIAFVVFAALIRRAGEQALIAINMLKATQHTTSEIIVSEIDKLKARVAKLERR